MYVSEPAIHNSVYPITQFCMPRFHSHEPIYHLRTPVQLGKRYYAGVFFRICKSTIEISDPCFPGLHYYGTTPIRTE